MAGEQVLMWSMLVIGVLTLGNGLAKGLTRGKHELLLGLVCIAQWAAWFGTGWVRYAAWAVLAPILVYMGKDFFTDRKPSSLWIALPFLVMILAIAVTETVFDHINVWQRLSMGAVALGATAALVLTVARLVQARRTRRALG